MPSDTKLVSYVVYVPHGETAQPFSIDVSEDGRVEDLKNAIRTHPDFKHRLEHDQLILLKCGTVPIQLRTSPPSSLVTCFRLVSEWVCDNVENETMEPAYRLKQYFPTGPASEGDGKIDVIAVTDSIIADLRASPLSHHAHLDHPPESRLHHDAVTFKIRCEDHDSVNPKLVWGTANILNGYVSRSELEPFIADVVERPSRAADNDTESAKNLLRYFESMLSEHNENQFQIVRGLLTDDKKDAPYAPYNHEMIHYVYASASMNSHLERLARGEEGLLTIDQAHFIVLTGFSAYWTGELEGAQCTFDKQFPFPLVAETLSEAGRVLLYRKYRPQPHAVFLKHGFPRFLVELACALNYALALRRDARINDEKFFLMGAFFTKDWLVHRYFIYVKGKKTYFHERTFHMVNTYDLTTFLFEFYNYARHVRNEDTLGDKKRDIAGLVQSINAKKYKSLHTNVTEKSKKHSSSGESQVSTNSSPNQSTSKPIRTVMADALRKSGIEMRSVYPEELEPLVELPAHVVEGTSREGEGIVAKLPRKDSEELRLLQKLSSQKFPHNHAIPLLDTVQSSLGPLIVLPQATPLSIPCLFHDVLKDESVQLSHQLIEGVAFLHRQKIAHLDIKLSNLVYSFKIKRLYIIDFDIAMQCRDVDEIIEISCGTPGWSAPEIIHDNNKPLRAFSPIRADLWSCGKVLQSFDKVTKEKDEDILLLMNLLMEDEPRRRPLLHEVVDEEPDFWTSRRLRQCLMRHISEHVQQAMIEGDVKPKRTLEDVGLTGGGLASKVLRQVSGSTAP